MGYNVVASDDRIRARFGFTSFDRPLRLIEARMEELRRDKDTAEQAGTGQPATRPESKSEGSTKPQPESEGRFR